MNLKRNALLITMLLFVSACSGKRSSPSELSVLKYSKVVMSLSQPDCKLSKKEKFMSKQQLEYFKKKLLRWKTELILESKRGESRGAIEYLKQDSIVSSDLIKTEQSFELSTRDRYRNRADAPQSSGLRTRDEYRKLIAKIDEALQNIEIGKNDYCEITGNPILLEY